MMLNDIASYDILHHFMILYLWYFIVLHGIMYGKAPIYLKGSLDVTQTNYYNLDI